MTLDEAIKHAEEVAYQKDLESGFDTDNERYAMTDKERADCKECAAEHRQLAEWLKELKDYKERIPSYEAGYNDAKREIALSGEYQRAYERGKKDAEQTRWIPVSEKYEHHIDHTDCIWYGDDSGCPVTCSQYRDGWNDAMDYIFKNGDGYRPYRRDENG